MLSNPFVGWEIQFGTISMGHKRTARGYKGQLGDIKRQLGDTKRQLGDQLGDTKG